VFFWIGIHTHDFQKLASYKEQLDETTELYEQCKLELDESFHRREELAHHVETLIGEIKKFQEERDQLVHDADTVDQEHDAEYRRQRRAIETKESALQSALDDLARTQSLLDQRNAEYQAVKDALHTLETESKRAGETHTTSKFSLQLEVDRLQRDLERLEGDLSRARRDLDEKDDKNRDRDNVLDKLHAENRDLAAQLAAQTQARLNLSEKLDDTQSGLKAAEAETASLRARVQELEQRLSKDQRSLMSAEAQYRDQLTERNTLLLTIYQYMDKILGVDKTPVSPL
jgi:chromosome segregation ATPase